MNADNTLSKKNLCDHYIWHSKDDSKTRSSHANRNGKVFSMKKPPEGGHPGQAFGCRCKAEMIDFEKAKKLWEKQKEEQEKYEHSEEDFEHVKTEEGTIWHPYLDTRGYVTIGIGKMIPDKSAFVKLILLKGEHGKKNRPIATEKEKSEEWGQLQKEKHNLEIDFKKKHGYAYTDKSKWPNGNQPNLHNQSADSFKDKGMHTLRISDEEAKKHAREHIDKSIQRLKKYLPDYDRFPNSIKRALIDMAYNLGPRLNPENWKELFNALWRKDFKTASKECHRKGIDEDRNDRTEELFLKAIPKKLPFKIVR